MYNPQTESTPPVKSSLQSSAIAGSFNARSNPNDVSQRSHEPTHSRSCMTCHRRKVRCNKRWPCSNCIKFGIECVFPAPGRAPRKSRRPQDAELLSRLRRLEGVIDKLKEKDTEDDSLPVPPPGEDVRAAGDQEQRQPQETGETKGAAERCPFILASDPKTFAPQNMENEFGRLAIDEGRSRYLSDRSWATLGDEIEELQDILDPSSSDEEDHPSPQSPTNSSSHDGFLFGFHSLSHSLRGFHPPPEQVPVLWNAYLENVAPLVTILHKPTIKKLFDGPARTPDNLHKNSEALVFTIYFVAIVSMSPKQCQSQFGETRVTMVSRYRFAVEQALARANFLNTQNLMLLQAAVLLLVGVRHEDDSKFVWAITALVIRLAQGLGLHRDGTNFGLKPFETEMRRRLWWHICLLDFRSSADHGIDMQIHEQSYDTRLPLNVNDNEISPEMKELPPEHEGCTEMTFSLVRFEISAALQKLSSNCLSGRSRPDNAQPTSSEACGNVIQMVNRRMEERYIKYCDLSIPIFWICATVTRLVLAKIWLIIHHPLTRIDRQTPTCRTYLGRIFSPHRSKFLNLFI